MLSDNEANPAYHRQTTGPEILSDFAGKRLDTFVTGWGTGGTLTGAGQVLKRARPDLKIVVCEPAEAQLLGEQPFKSHKIQGWTPDFVPAVLDRAVSTGWRSATAGDRDRARARPRGHLRRDLGGGTFAGALQVARAALAGVSSRLPTPASATCRPLFEGVNQSPTGVAPINRVERAAGGGVAVGCLIR
jgi:cysteine synthase A